MAMPCKCFCSVLALVQHVALLCLQWPLIKLFPTAWTDSKAQCTVYLSLMSMNVIVNNTGGNLPWFLGWCKNK